LLQSTASGFAAQVVAPQEIYRIRADIFAPCALGGVINKSTVPQLEVEMVVGAANNQLLEPRNGNLQIMRPMPEG
jgi:leucine dehydrogenase